jgi:hypothetical protein
MATFLQTLLHDLSSMIKVRRPQNPATALEVGHQRYPRRLAARINLQLYRLHLRLGQRILQDDCERVAPVHRGFAHRQQLPCSGRMTRHQYLFVCV